MGTATKNSRVRVKKQVEVTESEEGERDGHVVSGKIKKPLEIDDHEPAIGIEDKVEDDPLSSSMDEDESGDDAGLDGEELNPFGDRWEE